MKKRKTPFDCRLFSFVLMGLLYQNIHFGALSDLSFFQYVSINLDYVHHLPSELQTNMIGHCSCVATDFFLEIFL